MFVIYKSVLSGMTHIFCPHCNSGISYYEDEQPRTCGNCKENILIREHLLKSSRLFRRTYYREGNNV